VVLGWDGCAEVVAKKETTLRKYSDPDTGRELSLRDAIRLDTAYRRAGGLGAPLFEAYATGVEMGFPADQGNEDDLISAVANASKETGEAIAAALMAAQSGDPVLLAMGIKEAGEGVEALTTMLHQLQRGFDERRRLPHGPSPCASGLCAA
jgi:hypothetical protein